MRKRTKILLFFTNNLIWAILIFSILISALFVQNFFTVRNLINIFYHSSILGMLVLGESLILITGMIDLGIESVLAFAPTISVLLMLRWLPSINPFLAIFITLLIGFTIGLINGFFITKIKIYHFLQTLAMLIILRGVVSYLIPISVYGINPIYTFLGRFRIGLIPVAVIVFILLYIIMDFVLHYLPYGRYLFAIGGNRTAAFISGVNVDRVVFITFGLSGMFAAIAGLLMTGRLNAVTNIMGEGMIFMTIAAAVLGGASLMGGEGRMLNIIAGVLLIGLIDNVLNLIGVNPYLVYATKGLLIFIAIMLDHMKLSIRSLLIRREDIFTYKSEMKKEKNRIIIDKNKYS